MTSYANASSETSNDNTKENTRRNKKTQALSALLSATALGVFLEGCGGGDTPASTTTLGSQNNPFVAKEGKEGGNIFEGKEGLDSVSYIESSSGVEIELTDADAIVGGGADGDTLTGIQNLIGSTENDVLTGNGQANSLQGGEGDDTLNGGGGDDTLSGGRHSDTISGGAGDDTLVGGAQGDTLNGEGGTDNYVFASGHGEDTILIDTDGGNLFFRAAESFEDFTIEHDSRTNYVKITIGEEEDKDSVAIAPEAYTHGHYTLYYGEDEILGALIVGTGTSGETLTGGAERNVIIGTAQVDTINGGKGEDTLDGGAGADTYIFSVGDGTDSITDVAGDTMTLRFDGAYVAADFAATSNNFNRDGDNLVIGIDKVSNSITDQVTINNAYNTEGLAFTINIQYGAEGDTPATATDIWSSLTAA